MNFDKYTIKSQEAINKAAQIALGAGHQAVETGHLLKALIEGEENLISFLLKKLAINKTQVKTEVEGIINTYPKVSGQHDPS